MATVRLPGPVAPCRELASTPAAALALATDLRTVAVGVKDDRAWAVGHGAPPGWQGDAGVAAGARIARFATRLDATVAALDRAVPAADRFEDRLRTLQRERALLEAERVELDETVARVRFEAGHAGIDAVSPHLVPIEVRAADLCRRAEALVAAIDRWNAGYADAEADVVASLRAVDTATEADRAAADPVRPDTATLARLLRTAAGPEAVHDRWSSLSRTQQQALLTEHPELVGAVDGVPVDDRDEANRAALDADLDHWRERADDGQLTDDEARRREIAEVVREQLDEYARDLDEDGDPLAHLLLYEPGAHTGDGAVAVSLGDPDTADHAVTFVNGLTTEASDLPDNLERVEGLHADATALDRGSVAVTFWHDYDAPSADSLSDPEELTDLLGVVGPGRARDGATALADFLAGLAASDEGPPAHATLVGHSYGSTTASYAAQDGAPIDELVLTGSPGVAADSATALTDADVWVGSDDLDPVTLLGSADDRGGPGALGHDPAQAEFGAHRFATDGSSPRWQDLLDNHGRYLDEGTARDRIADIATGGAPDAVPHRGSPDAPHLTLDELLIGSGAYGTGAWVVDRAVDGVAGLGEALVDVGSGAPFRVR